MLRPSPRSAGDHREATHPHNGRFFGTELLTSAPTQTPILFILSIHVNAYPCEFSPWERAGVRETPPFLPGKGPGDRPRSHPT